MLFVSEMNDLLKDDEADLIMKTIQMIGDIEILKEVSWMLLFQNEMNKQDVHSYFMIMVSVMKTLYPNGLDESANLVQKKYFKNFIDLCKNKKAFSWDNESDVEWVNCYDYGDYLKMIFENYIDKEGEEK